jgi:hypothetical protein
MRQLPDIRLSRRSLALVVVLSALATYVILTSGSGRSPVQTAALAALREPEATRTVVAVAPRPAPRATVSPPSAQTSTPATTADTSTGPSPVDSSAPVADTPADTPTSTPTESQTTTTTTTNPTTTPTPTSNLPKVGHVFEIALSTTGYAAAFRRRAAPYLETLVRKGALVRGYRSLGSSELADALAAVSGQPPNRDTRGGCTTYAEFPTAVVADHRGLVPGTGCVYPETALTIGDQVSAKGHVWRAYIEGQGTQSCIHPNSNAVDDVALTGAGPGYDTRHNPFIYFHSLLDLGDCSTDDLDLSKLPRALSSAGRTATFTYLAPSACADARTLATAPSAPPAGTTTTATTTTATTSATGTSTVPTVTVSGALGIPMAAACPAGPVGIAAEDAFLKAWVSRILRSAAYRRDGVLVIAFSGDGRKRTGSPAATGALVLSHWTRRGSTVTGVYTPYSLLRSLEDMLRLTPLADAAAARSFAAAVLPKHH